MAHPSGDLPGGVLFLDFLLNWGMKSFWKHLVACNLILVAPVVVLAQASEADNQAIIRESKSNNQALTWLSQLSKDIGPRRTGSQNLGRAQDWAMKLLKSWGWQNVRLEKWGEVPVGFERGKNYYGGLVAPFKWNLKFSSAAWTAGSNGPRRAEVVLEPQTLEELRANPSKYKGKWILMQTMQSMRGSRPSPPMTADERTKNPAGAVREDVEKALDALGIAGKVFGQSEKRNWVHTHGTWSTINPKSLPTDVRVNISYSDHRLVRKTIESGRKPEVEFNVDQKFIPGAVPQYNVVADLPGFDKADEIVMIGGHLDSWDGPGSQGTSDNGTGTCINLEAARLISTTRSKPRRTLRIVLWSGEEQGLLGSQVDAAKVDRMKIAAVFNEDSGSNFQDSISAHPKWVPILERAFQPYRAAFPQWPVRVNSTNSDRWPRGGGSDHAAYLAKGIPAFAWGKRGPQSYGFIWHTLNDTFENAFPEALAQMSVNHALLALNVACSDEILWRPETMPVAFFDLRKIGGYVGCHEDPEIENVIGDHAH